MTANSGVSLSVPATSRERRDSTKCRNAYGTNWLRSIDVNSVSRIAKGIIVLRNIGVYVIITRRDFSQPLSLAQLDSSPILLRNSEEQKVTFSAPANVVR